MSNILYGSGQAKSGVIYRGGNAPPAAADGSFDGATLIPFHCSRRNVSVVGSISDRWTHLLIVDPGVDIRDGYNASAFTAGNADTVYMPDANGTPYLVRYVSRVGMGTLYDRKVVYLDRGTPPWSGMGSGSES
jgi:hypothetical protein